MTRKNPLKRFAKCQIFEMCEGSEHFEWVDDSFCDKVGSVVVAILVKMNP